MSRRTWVFNGCTRKAGGKGSVRVRRKDDPAIRAKGDGAADIPPREDEDLYLGGEVIPKSERVAREGENST